MANTKQAKKMIRKTKTRTSYNRWWNKRVKTAVKKLDEVVAKANVDEQTVNSELASFQKTVDKAAKNNVMHNNKAIRMKSTAQKKVNTTKK